MDEAQQEELRETYQSLNPVQLRKDLLSVKLELGEFTNLVRFLDEAPIEVGSGF